MNNQVETNREGKKERETAVGLNRWKLTRKKKQWLCLLDFHLRDPRRQQTVWDCSCERFTHAHEVKRWRVKITDWMSVDKRNDSVKRERATHRMRSRVGKKWDKYTEWHKHYMKISYRWVTREAEKGCCRRVFVTASFTLFSVCLFRCAKRWIAVWWVHCVLNTSFTHSRRILMFRWYHLKCVCVWAWEGANESSNYRLSLAMNNISWCSCLLRTFLLIFVRWLHSGGICVREQKRCSWNAVGLKIGGWYIVYRFPFRLVSTFNMCVCLYCYLHNYFE